MSQKLDLLPGVANLEGGYVEHDLSFLMFNNVFWSDDTLNTDERMLSQPSEENGGKWSYILNTHGRPLNQETLARSKNKCKLILLNNLKYFFPTMRMALQVYKDALLNLRLFGLYYKKKSQRYRVSRP